MTVKVPYFKLLIVAILVAGTMLSCNGGRIVEYNTVYKGYSVEGVHSRAVYAFNEVAFVAGKDGHVTMHYLDTNANTIMNQVQIDGVEDFRDIHYNSKGVCMMINSGKSGAIWAVIGGGSVRQMFDSTGVFLNGLDYWDDDNFAIVYGDPVDGKFFLVKTSSMGRFWEVLTPEVMPDALENEAGFAASGTGIQAIGDSTVYFGTGNGEVARLFCSFDQGNTWEAKPTPMHAGESYGIYSMYFWTETEGVIIGGSYKDSTYKDGICQYTNDAGDTWENRSSGLLGYCSSVCGTPDGSLLVATGRMGTFYSTNQGKKWELLTETPYYSCSMSHRFIVLSGRNGTLEFIEYKLSEK